MSPKPRRLHDFPFSGNGYKIRLALTQLGLPFEYRVVNLLKGESHTPDFLARNPMGQIPVLELDDGTHLVESNAILFWLTEGTHLMPESKLERARVIQWMTFEQSNIDKVLGRARFLKRWPHVWPATQRDWDGWYELGNRALGVLEGALEGGRFLVGNAYSTADICLYGYVHCADEGGFDLSKYPSVMAWLARVREQPRHIPITAHG